MSSFNLISSTSKNLEKKSLNVIWPCVVQAWQKKCLEVVADLNYVIFNRTMPPHILYSQLCLTLVYWTLRSWRPPIQHGQPRFCKYGFCFNLVSKTETACTEIFEPEWSRICHENLTSHGLSKHFINVCIWFVFSLKISDKFAF